MKQHLQTKHGILSPDDLQLNSNEEIQIHIDKMIRKVTPYCVPKQVELKQVTAEWLVTDSLPFNVVHRKGYKKMIQRFDPAFILPNNKGIKKDLTIAYQKSILALKKLISITCETASITTDLWTAHTVERIEYLHTGERIKEYLNEKIEEFELTEKIVYAITDNEKI
ncbi:7416_t:CDS:2 [Funneliformis geosporum]|nr:7416_t:CDS:2 [Funneliformis geosporum]